MIKKLYYDMMLAVPTKIHILTDEAIKGKNVRKVNVMCECSNLHFNKKKNLSKMKKSIG